MCIRDRRERAPGRDENRVRARARDVASDRVRKVGARWERGADAGARNENLRVSKPRERQSTTRAREHGARAARGTARCEKDVRRDVERSVRIAVAQCGRRVGRFLSRNRLDGDVVESASRVARGVAFDRLDLPKE